MPSMDPQKSDEAAKLSVKRSSSHMSPLNLTLPTSTPSSQVPISIAPATRVVPVPWLPLGVKSGMASGLAGAVVKIILQPFDTIKTVQQANKMQFGPIQAAKEILVNRGVRGLWGGIGVTVIGSTPSVAVYFGTYSSLRSYLMPAMGPDYNIMAIALSAMIGNTVASVFRTPYEVLKQRVQYGIHKSAIEALRHSHKTEGTFGIFTQGKLSSQIVRDVPFAVITLVSYESLQGKVDEFIKDIGGRKLPTPITDAICGSLAGGIGALITTPMDVIKTRMQTNNRNGYKNVGEAFYRIYRDEGMMTFLSGVAPRLMHKVPANGLFFLCYEFFRSILGVT